MNFTDSRCSGWIRFITLLSFLFPVFFLTSLEAFKDAKSVDTFSRMGIILSQAQDKKERIPVLSVQFPSLSPQGAYKVQRQFVKIRLEKDRIAGFKAGLTSTASMKRFGVREPVTGILFTSGRVVNSTQTAVIDSKKTGTFMLMMETEIGFIVKTAIKEPLKNTNELKRHIGDIAPVIELPDLGFTQMPKLKGPDIIAANVSSRYFITGMSLKLDSINPDSVTVSLKDQDGNVINQARGGSVINGQWQTLLWMVNKIIGQGWSIEPGQILITGALGKMIPAKPGTYSAQFDSLGNISFEIK